MHLGSALPLRLVKLYMYVTFDSNIQWESGQHSNNKIANYTTFFYKHKHGHIF